MVVESIHHAWLGINCAGQSRAIYSYFLLLPAKNVTLAFHFLQATQFSITYLPFAGSEEHIPGRRAVTELIEKANISSRTFSFSKVSKPRPSNQLQQRED